jgi:hypothetical protein
MESLNHLDTKIDLYSLLLENDRYAQVEKCIGSSRPDILTELNGFTVAVEIQCSPISTKAILGRMRKHTDHGAYTLWLLQENTIQTEIYAKNLKWINFIQHIQSGVLFLINPSGHITPARIDNSISYSSNNEIVTGRKVLDTSLPIELNEIQFNYNDQFSLNITTYEPWWIESYLDLF